VEDEKPARTQHGKPEHFRQTGPSVSNPQPLEQNGVSFVDPNGLEADGAGAVEGNVKLENTDLTLQIIWVALALGLMVLVMTNESGDHSNQSPREPLARNDWTVVTDHGHE
jgi:hypothetical protein